MKRVVRQRSDMTPETVRGGISMGAVLTGVVVAFGSMMTTAVLIGLLLAAGGYAISDLTPSTVQVGLGLGIALLLSQLLAYMWGGYTAGRMGRGAGFAHGALVPAVALLIGAIVAGTGMLLQRQPQVDVPFLTGRSFDLGSGTTMEAGIVLTAASILAMFIGGVAGGILGSRWHGKLESRQLDESAIERQQDAEHDRRSVIDVTDKDQESRTAGQRQKTTVTYPNGDR